MNLTIPSRHDPLARVAVLALLALALWSSVARLEQPAAAQGIIIIDATPTPSLPTPALALDAPAPALMLIAPTPAAEPVVAPALMAAEPQAVDVPPADPSYLTVVGAQAPHAIRDGDNPPAPPSFDTGPIAYPDQGIVIDPNVPAAAPSIAVAVPPISSDQAAVLGQRTSNGCAPGETFYPRTGCHAAGSGGPQPGAVGEVGP